MNKANFFDYAIKRAEFETDKPPGSFALLLEDDERIRAA